MSLDARWCLELNALARRTGWAHSVGTAYALWGALAILAALLVTAWWLPRRRSDAPGQS